METLTFQDTQQLLHAIEELHSLHDLSSISTRVLAIVHRLVPSEIPEFHITNTRSRQVSRSFLPGYPGYTPELAQLFHRYFREHPIVSNMPHTLNGAYKVSDFITQSKIHHLEGLYQQFLRVLACEDQMIMFLTGTQPQSWDELSQWNVTLVGIALNRSRRNFTERDRQILTLLRPHLTQAYNNAQRYHQLQQQYNQIHQSLNYLNLIILNDLGKIVFITPTTTQWLQNYFAKSIHSDYLPEHLWAWVKHQIVSPTSYDPLGSRLPLRITQADKQLVIRLIIDPNGGRYLLLLEEQSLSLRDALELLGLSLRETEVLYWVMRGKDNQAIAQQLGLYGSTVRKHLESIYRKLGVQSRTEAISQALDKLGILTSPPMV